MATTAEMGCGRGREERAESREMEPAPARSDVEWGTNGERPCNCGESGCLICEVENLAGC